MTPIDKAIDYTLAQMRSYSEITPETLTRRFGITLWGAAAAIRAAETILDEFTPPAKHIRKQLQGTQIRRNEDSRQWGYTKNNRT